MSTLNENPIVDRLTKQRKKLIEKHSQEELWFMYYEQETKKKATELLVIYHFPIVLEQIRKYKHHQIDFDLMFSNGLYSLILAFEKYKLGRSSFRTFYLRYFFSQEVLRATINNDLIRIPTGALKTQLKIKKLLTQGFKKEEILLKLKIKEQRYYDLLNKPNCSLGFDPWQDECQMSKYCTKKTKPPSKGYLY